jgi:hypothetical protein
MASGIKLAGRQYGVLYGTREVAIDLLIPVNRKKQTHKDSVR